MRRRWRWAVSISCGLAAAAIALAVCLRGASPKGQRPDPAHEKYNVVLVSIDTLRADRLGCYGYRRRPTSPAIDGFAREGVLFENDITAAPWTTPSHLSMLTSLPPSAHGVTASFVEFFDRFEVGDFGFMRIPESRVTLAEVLAEHGFATAAFTAGGPMDPKIGFGQGFGLYTTDMYKLREENVGEMLAWVRRNAERQFFLFWHHFEVHAPYLDPRFVGDAVAGDRAARIREDMDRLARVPLRDMWPFNAVRFRAVQEAALKRNGAFERGVAEALYTGSVASADAWLARLLDALKGLGLYDRTLIVVTSDHGEEFGERDPGLWYNEHGHTLSEEMVRVPLVVRLPHGYAGGVRVPQVVTSLDVMPTILDVLKLAPSKDEMQGRSLAPLWESGGRGADDRTAFVESSMLLDEIKGVRTPRYKYAITIDEATVAARGRKHLPEGPLDARLYDLRDDPGERRDLLSGGPDAHAASVARELEKALREHLAAQRGGAERTMLGVTTLDQLKGLGYVTTGPDAGR
jgi:arylsulfatase A-like enzyme